MLEPVTYDIRDLKDSWVRFPIKVDFVTPKLSKIEEQRQDQLFRRGDYGNKSHYTENSGVRVLKKIISVAWKLRRIEKCKNFFSARRL